MQVSQPFNAPLADFNLIEASAGTGKTYTITALYLRLVIEAQIPVNRILVVTYTKAATNELRNRIRNRILQIRRAFLDNCAADDDELAAYLLSLSIDREHTMRRLSNALRGFDEASIFTIHGFCQRVLSDNAFDSGLSFNTELVADINAVLQEIVEDFWRREFYPGSPLIVQYFLDQKITPNTLLKQIAPHVGKPYLKVNPASEIDNDSDKLEQQFCSAFLQVRELWQSARATIEELLLTSPALNRNSYRVKSIPAWLTAMDAYLESAPHLSIFEQFSKFTATQLRKSTNKQHSPPEHAFFDACEILYNVCIPLIDYCRSQIPVKLLDYCNTELAKRKRHEQIQSYDDLLLNLRSALQAPRRGAALANTIRQRYKAALIDEFQDTDPVQYEIFQRIYAGSGQPVFLVGDPKQAIYSFRGADIFAYLTARRDTQKQYTLDVNWRSDPNLLLALNAIFGAVKEQPFMFDGIPFHPALPAPKNQPEPLCLEDSQQAPLQLWSLQPDNGAPLLNRPDANKKIARATAVEIARLLNSGANGKALIGKRPLAGGDIAVLVRTHKQGLAIRQHLLALNVPSVQYADDSVFSTDEAQQLEWLLSAVSESSIEERIMAILATPLFGLSGAQLYDLQEDERTWSNWLEKFQGYQLLWREQGFMRFFRAWLMSEQVPQRLLLLSDGERRLTNLLHLAELAHLATHKHPGIIGLLKWLGEQRRLPSKKDDEQQLRLESDENLVRIVTIHKSKGLEYPIVFCPFVWDGQLHSARAGATLLYHDPNDSQTSYLIMGGDKEHPGAKQAQNEEMAESLRIFYVAMTRAKQRCYLVWGRIKSADSAAPAWLLHHPTVKDLRYNWLEATQKHFKALDNSGFNSEVERVFKQVAAQVNITPLPRLPDTRYQPNATQATILHARQFTRSLRNFWRIGSFSGLIAGAALEAQDYDINASDIPEERLITLDRFTFPRGVKAGTFLHKLFERLDFAHLERNALEAQVSESLSRYGFASEQWTSCVVQWVEEILATPLHASGFSLNQVTWKRRINELEFYYPVAHLHHAALAKLLREHGYTSAPIQAMSERLNFNPLRGYMRGYIDLVFEAEGRFYLVDYKSNWLGTDAAAYQAPQLGAVMAREAYILQYLIYAIALHRYLQLRLAGYDYQQHFGGVLYLFLRGMHPDFKTDCGIFYDRPKFELIAALDRIIATGK